ncbi:MAG: 4Fe-4S dicluster domain-containing protein [Mycobacterium leprae]
MTKRLGMVIDLTTCLGCQACSAACSVQNETPYWDGKFRTTVEDIERGSFPDVTRTFFPHLCMHCEDAPCARVCPTGATFKNADGVVMIDYNKCMGCKACIEACPYGARYVYEKEHVKKAKEIFGEENQHRVPHVDKCNFCYEERTSQGDLPACAATCPASARVFGDLNDPKSAVAKLVNAGKAKPIGEHFGTKPKLFYIR